MDTVRARNMRIRLYGQEELRHCCDKCSCMFTDKDGNSGCDFKIIYFYVIINTWFSITAARFYFVIVIDGISIGCPCCGKHNCHIPLGSNHNRFCPMHQDLDGQCAIVGCERPIRKSGPNEAKTLVCTDPKHREIECVHTQKGQARFVLKDRLLRQRVSHPEDAVAKDVGVDELEDLDDVEEEFTVVVTESGEEQAIPQRLNSDGPDSSDHGAKPPRKVCAQFGQRRSHNEQIFVAPCGDIIAQETFFGAEAVSSVVMSVSCAYLPSTLIC